MGSENLGIEYLSSFLKEHGHETNLVFDPSLFNDKYWFDIPLLYHVFKKKDEKIISEVIRNKPDIVCFSVFTDNYRWACNLASKIKKKINVPIVFGGIHATSVPEIVIKNSFVDFVFMGEAEHALLDLADKKDPIKIQNLVYKKGDKVIKNPLRPLIQDLDELPFPDKRLFKKYLNFNQYMISTSRGCPFQCTYCYSNYLSRLYRRKGRFLRRRSVENVINELQLAKKEFDIKKVSFEDDVFTMDKKWLKEFIDRYKNTINLPFRCITHPLFLDAEVAGIIKNSPCYKIEMGIQTMDEEIRRKLLRRYETNEQLINVMSVCRTFKLPFYVDHMFGFPGQDERVLRKEALFYNKYRPKRITCYWLQYFPKTDIVDIMDVNKEEINKIERGICKMYIVGGSVKGEKKKKMIKDYVILFRTMQLMPKFLVKLILNLNIHKLFHNIPDILITPLDFLVALKARDFKVFSYGKYYLNYLFKN